MAAASHNRPAGQAGIHRRDIILRITGEKIASQKDFYRKLWQTQAGREVSLVVLRKSRFLVLTIRPIDR
jgi:S1-C subfamily serine protease